MKVQLQKLALVGALSTLFSTAFIAPAHAVEIEVQGEGHSEITPDFTQVQTMARKGAVKKAVSMAVVDRKSVV